MLRRADGTGVLTCEDALNRFPLRCLNKDSRGAGNGDEDSKRFRNSDSTLRIMMYIFPRQFALHNAFTSHVDTTQTAQKFQDYTLREEEIVRKFRKFKSCTEVLDVRVPKRLRGKPEHLVQRLQTLHARCSYAALLQHYCPVCISLRIFGKVSVDLHQFRLNGTHRTIMLVNTAAALRPLPPAAPSRATFLGAARSLSK